jgi:integrase
VLTIQSVKAMKPTAGRREIPDSVCPGLYFVVQSSGAKSWAVRYRFAGKPCKVTLGEYPKIPLTESDEARKARLAKNSKSDAPDARGVARTILAAVATGRNPAAEKKEARRLNSTGLPDADLIKTVWDEYVERHLDTNLKESSADRFKSLFEKHILPQWKSKQIREITKRDVLNAVDEAGKRGPYAANSTVTVLSAFFNWCLGRDMIAVSPVQGVKKPSPELSRERVLTDEEIKAFWKGCDKIGFVFGPMFQMLLLTGARRNEVAEMTRRELDLGNRIWTIPAARTKNSAEHKIYLSDAALTLIKSVPRTKSKFVFSITGSSPSSGFSKAKRNLDKATPGLAAYRLHDLRRTAATGMARLGIQLIVVEKALNHVSGSFAGIVSTYQRHTYAEETKAAFVAWGNFIAALVNGETAKIIPIQSRRERQKLR